jgi:polygalacturonase
VVASAALVGGAACSASTEAPGVSSGIAPVSTQAPPVGIDVRRFGARGDGVADDTAALQQALDAALLTNDHSVHMPAGAYLISAPLRYGDGLTLTGDGPSATMIRNTTTRTNGTVMLAPSRQGVHDVRFQAFGLDQRADWYDRDGESNTSPLFDVGSTANATIEDVAFHNVRTIAVYADTPKEHPTVGLQVLRNNIYEANGGGISLFGSMRDLDIHGNVIAHTKDDAIALQDHNVGDYPTDARITNNVIQDCSSRTVFGSTPRGILLFGADHVSVDSNTISRVLASGILVGDGANRRGTHLSVTNNVVSGAGTNNNTTDVPSHGIWVLSADHVLLAGNQVSGSKDPDYMAEDSTDVEGP